ncbi:DUF1150 family protein [Devosia sp. RR2S18]|jgi:hypothetical protein|uniref:DUF1150 family protein n=1 Tax=Devosia rhizosphaerae TaxID=3049774 RepID=UPI00253FB972|nr:DUF1150 family protein [Devosia sp. RR2S18]WIJ25282.1 DUF1150 family protein [Devosia sp. RR2S18]HEV7292771.1 DUF1150 family protein [Devosia sp.]
MYEKRSHEAISDQLIHPLKSLTRAQFAALGGDAVAYVRPVSGAILADMITNAEFDHATFYQLVMSADGTPLLVTDTEDAVVDWLGDKNLGLATVH